MTDEEQAARDAFRPDFAGAEPRFAADTDGPVLHVPVLRGTGVRWAASGLRGTGPPRGSCPYPARRD
ncbi:hypothetical protein HFP72_03675 [Nocardiopsis sp. ARC36]